jgi:hypothetical protein
MRFPRISRYSCQHSRSRTLHGRSPARFSAYGTLPYHWIQDPIRRFGAMLEPRELSAHVHLTSELLRTL